MTKEQEYKLRKAFGLILDSLNQSDEPKISTWLSVAGDYCKEVAEELKKC